VGCENSLVATSSSSPRSAHRAAAGVPSGDEIGVFEHYDDARQVVNRLLGGGIPASAVSIVGGDVTMVERVIARYSYGRAALTSSLTGSWIGVFVGLLVVVISASDTFIPLAAGGLIGAGAGMIVGMLLYSSHGANRPRYRSTQQVVAARYRVVVDSEVGGKARRVAQDAGGES
jgi:hypothetical protein